MGTLPYWSIIFISVLFNHIYDSPLKFTISKWKNENLYIENQINLFYFIIISELMKRMRYNFEIVNYDIFIYLLFCWITK